MYMHDLLSDITILHEYFMKINIHNAPETHIFIRSIKLSEEIWELNKEILEQLGYWRKGKLEEYSKKNMENEMADVIFSAFMLAKALNIDVNKAITNKIKIIKKKIWI